MVTCLACDRYALEHEPALLSSQGRVGVMGEVSIRDGDGSRAVGVKEVWMRNDHEGLVNLRADRRSVATV